MAFYRRARPIRRTAEEIAAEKAIKLAKSMTCQCCGRDIFAETGVIAHHGYERPAEGWQTASCFGARQLPFEVDRTILGEYIEMIISRQASVTRYRAEILADANTFRWTFKDKTVKATSYGTKCGETTCNVSAETFDACYAIYKEVTPYKMSPEPTYAGLKAAKLRELDGNLNSLAESRKWQEGRYKGWKQTHKRSDPGDPHVWEEVDASKPIDVIDLKRPIGDSDEWQF